MDKQIVADMLSKFPDLIDATPATISAHCKGWRGETGDALFVARPRTTSDVSALVRSSLRNGIHLVPQSGKTGLVGASVPDARPRQAILNLERLNTEFQVDRTNRTIQCSAGLKLSEINDKLAEHNLCLPIDLGADPCIGGMIATNTGGSRLLRYGDVRRHVLALTVVLGDADGSIIELGAPLRKNATGPDWKQLFIGTGAAFGIVTACTLSVERVPQHRAAALVSLPDAEALSDLLCELEDRFGSLVSAVEFMSANAMAAAHAAFGALKKPFGESFPEIAVLVELSCDWPLSDQDRSLDDILLEGLVSLWEKSDGRLGHAVFGRVEEMWAIRHAISEGVRKRGRLYAFDLSFRRGDVLAFRTDMKLQLSEQYPNISVCDFGHVGDGGLHFNLVDNIADKDWTPCRERNIRDLVISQTVEVYGGSFSAEHGIGPINFRYFDTYTSDKERELARIMESATSNKSFGRVHYS